MWKLNLITIILGMLNKISNNEIIGIFLNNCRNFECGVKYSIIEPINNKISED